MKTTFADIIDAAERLGWGVDDETEDGYTEATGIVEFYFNQGSPAGEDFGFTVEAETPEEMVNEIMRYALDFDTEEHAKMFIGASGAPSIKELVEDADAIKDMLQEFADAVLALNEQ